MSSIILRVPSLLLAASSAALFLVGCSGLSQQTTTAEDLVESPQVPEMFYPFHHTPVEGRGNLVAEEWTNRFLVQKKAKNCNAVVDDLQVLTEGPVDGTLRFNFAYRHPDTSNDQDFKFPQVSDNNAQLGPVSAGYLFLYYKYETKIRFAGDNTFAFYGQMATNPMPITPGEKGPPQIEFKPFLPANDAVGMKWWVKKEMSFQDFKRQYPIVSVTGNDVRFIECLGGPGGMMGVGWEGKKQYVIVYAGTCKMITHAKLYKISYPEGKTPEMVEMKPEDLRKEVKGWTFAEAE